MIRGNAAHLLFAAVLLAAAGASAAERVTAEAVWRPDAGFIEQVHLRCDRVADVAFAACFVAAMAQAGAAPAALALTRRLDSEAYLEALTESGGPIAVAHVFYPFRANENAAWLLVNGTPALIDVDDRHNLTLAALDAAPAYRAIARRYPQVSFWPGERGAAGPQIERNGRVFVVDYRLRDLCHACAEIGRVRFAFDFDAAGEFHGTRLVSVAARQ